MNSDQALKVTLTIEKNGNNYVFTMPMGVGHGEVYDVLCAMVSDIAELAKMAADKTASANPVTPPNNS